jgi:hypothetical protein
VFLSCPSCSVISWRVAERQGRLAGLGIVPMQDPARAAGMLPELRDSGLVGVEVGSNINGELIGGERFHQTIFLHTFKPQYHSQLGPAAIANAVAFPGPGGTRNGLAPVPPNPGAILPTTCTDEPCRRRRSLF